MENDIINWNWEGNSFAVKILYSSAGVATQILVKVKGTNDLILIDVGDGTVRDLLALPNKVYKNIKTLLISHGHFDHIGGLFSLLCFYRMINRKDSLNILIPNNITEFNGFIKTFYEIYTGTISYSINKLDISNINRINHTNISAFPVQHRGSVYGTDELTTTPVVGYCLEKDNERIIYTGDTGYFKQLKTIINNADLVIIEGTKKNEGTKYHLSIDEAKEVSKGAKEHIIIHKMEYQ